MTSREITMKEGARLRDELAAANEKLITRFNAQRVRGMPNQPDIYTFRNELVYSHRDFDSFMRKLDEGKPSAIVSGLNPSGTLHLGHKVVFDTMLALQKKHNVKVFIPLSDDQSYLYRRVESQQAALKTAYELTKSLVAFGFEPELTTVVIDQIYTNIYNLSVRLAKHITLAKVQGAFGCEEGQNIGQTFYPAVQAAHIVLPEALEGRKNVLVPIGPDEDVFLMVARDVSSKAGYSIPSVIHMKFMPGTDGNKMSKSRGNSIFYLDDDSVIRKKIMASFSGGGITLEDHLTNGGDPTIDVACTYLAGYFLAKEESNELFNKYKAGSIKSSEVKKMLYDKVSDEFGRFKRNLDAVTEAQVQKILLRKDDRNTLAV
ncbi:MAG: tryptophan--tRNA ligase [Candidatus Micrarchaeota archaeon]|nr:tryptophan--tRNA ligase [Candidatus Micrarchaeota archaeon]